MDDGARTGRDLPLADELAAVQARMSGVLLSQETVTSTLGLVCSLAVEVLPVSLGAGATLTDPTGARTTAGASDPLVARADALQYELDEGPCLTAWAQRHVVRVDDLATDERWPRWARAARPLGIRSTLSAPLVAGDTAVGALKAYTDRPGAYSAREEHLLAMFAAQAAVLVANAVSARDAQRLSEDLQEAMRRRDAVNQARGIVMGRDGADADAALAALVATSRTSGAALGEVAEDLRRATVRRRRR